MRDGRKIWGDENMKMKLQRPNGFSLTEVMFAVVILSLGLVFVACQFPVALSVCRDVVDNTRDVVEAHNSQVMIELKLREVNLDMSVDQRPSDIDPGNLHMLLKPNYLVDDTQLQLVVDDLEYDVNGDNYINYLINGPSPPSPAHLNTEIDLPFWSQDSTNLLLPNYQDRTDAFLGDIGYAMSPPVDESNPEVEQLINSGWALETAIFEVSLKRKYSWCAFYHEPSGDNYNSIEYYIVTLRNASRDVRYAIQTPASFVFTDITDPLFAGRPSYLTIDNMVGPADQDRLFPVPWRVFLDDTALVDGTWYYWGQTPDGLNPGNQPPAVFSVRPAVGMLLRTGSIIIDADPPDGIPPANFARVAGGSGNIYEVAKVEWDDDIGRYWITLRTPLDNDLFSFWFFPPPVLRDGVNFDGFDDFQPVVNVTKKIIRFD